MEKNKTAFTLNCSVHSFLQKPHFLKPVDKQDLSRSDRTSRWNTITLKRS
jgi:hypothetical protein